MRSSTKDHLAKWRRYVQTGFQRAFSTEPDMTPHPAEDVELLERMADVIVKRGMAAPATVFLESMGPMNFLGSQALHFLSPIIDCACNAKEIEQIARLLERRDSIPRLIALMEAKSAPPGAKAR